VAAGPHWTRSSFGRANAKHKLVERAPGPETLAPSASSERVRFGQSLPVRVGVSDPPGRLLPAEASSHQGFPRLLKRSHQGSLGRLLARPAEELRRDLRGLKGFGPETVDAILVDAGRRPYFVADACTRRILARHEPVPPNAAYKEGKRYCKRRAPQCEGCPFQDLLPAARGRHGDPVATLEGELREAFASALS
jgi:hypothetical protein